jgi:hypothetical protein
MEAALHDTAKAGGESVLTGKRAVAQEAAVGDPAKDKAKDETLVALQAANKGAARTDTIAAEEAEHALRLNVIAEQKAIGEKAQKEADED